MDSADETINVTDNNELSENLSTIKLNESYVLPQDSGKAVSDGKLYKENQKYPTVTMWGKPSCRCGKHYKYTWYKRTYIDYCPHCHRYNVLYDAHKYPARYEKELTCKRCGADYCINCGHEKYSWSKYYLRKA